MSLLMPLNICLETYGAAVHVVDSLLSSGFYPQSRRQLGRPTPEGVDFDRAVRAGCDDLRFEDAHAVWLVDVCGCSYDEAAIEAHTTRTHIAARVVAGRQHIRSFVIADLAATASSNP